MKRSIRLGGSVVPYTLERKRVKNINLRVRGGEVFVSAARWVPLGVIESFLSGRADYILSAMARTAPGEGHRYLPGETFFYLGRELKLALFQGGRTEIRQEGELLCVTLREPHQPESVERALAQWYRSESERLCRLSCARLLPLFAPYGVPQEIEIKMRTMRSCWGNCRPARRVVTFNALLAAVPEACIDYVVAHELTHFLHADHSSAFYAALARVMPDWKPRRAAMKPYGALLR